MLDDVEKDVYEKWNNSEKKISDTYEQLLNNLKNVENR
jgi:uncharacterized protein YukE